MERDWIEIAKDERFSGKGGPWPMDKPIEEIEAILSPKYYYGGFELHIQYLLTRLKKAESERDDAKELLRKYAIEIGDKE